MTDTDTYGLTYHAPGMVDITVAFDRFSFNRPTYNWAVSCAGEAIVAGGNLCGGCGRAVDLPDMLGALCSFIGAWLEATGPDSENWALFPESARDNMNAIGADLFAAVEAEMRGVRS